jgi:hypothetical protein
MITLSKVARWRGWTLVAESALNLCALVIMVALYVASWAFVLLAAFGLAMRIMK